MAELIKKIFKFRHVRWRWFGFYLFPRQRFEFNIGIDYSEGEYPLFFIGLVIIAFDITFAPWSEWNPLTSFDFETRGFDDWARQNHYPVTITKDEDGSYHINQAKDDTLK